MIFTKNKEGVPAIRAMKYKKYVAGKYARAVTRTFGAEVHIEYSRLKMTQQV